MYLIAKVFNEIIYHKMGINDGKKSERFDYRVDDVRNKPYHIYIKF